MEDEFRLNTIGTTSVVGGNAKNMQRWHGIDEAIAVLDRKGVRSNATVWVHFLREILPGSGAHKNLDSQDKGSQHPRLYIFSGCIPSTLG